MGIQTCLLWISHVIVRGSASVAVLPPSRPSGGPFISCTASTGQRVDWLGGGGSTTSCTYCCGDLLPGMPALVLQPGLHSPFSTCPLLQSLVAWFRTAEAGWRAACTAFELLPGLRFLWGWKVRVSACLVYSMLHILYRLRGFVPLAVPLHHDGRLSLWSY